MTKPLEQALFEAPSAQYLPQLLRLLLLERGEEPELPAGVEDQWRLFRALVNVRPPAPSDAAFLQMQDELLSGIIECRGVTKIDETEAVGADGQLRLWRGDITTLGTEAIVNAANSKMLGCFVPGHHCIDNAIHTFAGVQLRFECARLMEEQSFAEPTGMAKVTDSFNLPCKYVIHTVGPITEGAATEIDCQLLANCYSSCLDVAADAGCDSIAFCCISTGVFGFPQDKAAEIAVGTVRQWLEGPRPNLAVVFNVFSERDESLYRHLLC